MRVVALPARQHLPLVLAAPILFGALASVGLPAPAALLVGLGLATRLDAAERDALGKLASPTLAASVVLVGFGMHLDALVGVGLAGLAKSSLTLALALGLGHVLGKGLRVEPRIATLISAGTGICGGTAIAALTPAVGAKREETTLALLAVFAMNGVAALVLPTLGRVMGYSPERFGLLAALAVHDTSSVVGAATTFGASAAAVATTVKLARAAYLVPVSLGIARLRGEHGVRPPFPGVLLGFVLAATFAALVPMPSALASGLPALGRVGFVVSLGLVGLGFEPVALGRLPLRVLAYAAILWCAVLGTALLLTA